MEKKPETEYLAIVTLSYGGGSFGRAPTKEKAVAICKRAVEQDWSSMFHLDGVEVNVGLFDITGHDNVFWDHRGVHPDTDPSITFDLLETVKVTLSVPKQRKKKKKA